MVAPIYNATKHAINGFVRTLAPLDKRLGVRVTAVAPGVIKTPLWTEAPEKMKLIGKLDEWVTPEWVAEKMVDLVEREEIEVLDDRAPAPDGGERGSKIVKVEGGFILEVGKGQVRKVEAFMDPGPSGLGSTVGGLVEAEEEILERLKGGDWGRS